MRPNNTIKETTMSLTKNKELRRQGQRHDWIGYDLRQAVLARDRGRCVYCGRRLRRDTIKIDHLVPVSKGGTTDLHNLVASCIDCNAEKDDLLPLDFIDQWVGKEQGQDGTPLTEGQARRVWRVLVALAGARWSERTAFTWYQVRGRLVYPFDSKLGLGGMFWNQGGRWFVTCPLPDRTPERLRIMEQVNRLLEQIRMEGGEN
jgi:hypothetical protein